jgi:outer membrane protein assembly factor BamB
MDHRRNRRAVLAGLAGAVTSVGGCGEGSTPTATPRTSEERPRTPTTAPSPPTNGNRPTATPRSPRTLDVGGAWAQRGFDARHAGSSDAGGVPTNGTDYWNLRRVRSGPPVLADGRLFHVGKIGADPSGTSTITRTREESAGTAHPVYGQPALFARDASAGTIDWTTPIDSPGVRWPAVDGGRVFVSTGNAVLAFDAETGTTEWRDDLDDRSVGPPTVADEHVVVPIHGVVSGGDYVERPAIVGYDVENGERRWSVEPPKRHSRIAVADGTVFAVTEEFDETGVLIALSIADGGERWRVEVPGAFFAEPAIAGDAILVGADDHLRALETDGGSERWSREVTNVNGVAADGSVAVAAGSTLHALSLVDGSERWTASYPQEDGYGDGSYVTPAIGSGTVYAGTEGFPGQLRALDIEGGEEGWRASFPETVVEGDMVVSGLAAQPTVADGAVYAYAYDGLYAFGPAESEDETSGANSE